MTAANNLAEQLENMMEGVKKSAKVEHHHRHTIDIRSSKVFLSLALMVLTILGLFYYIGEQRRSICQYRSNDLKYRYIKMVGKVDEKSLYYLEQQFRYANSSKVVRKQVEEYEESVKEQAVKLEKAKRNSKDVDRMRKKEFIEKSE
jgi:hypothetical protein